MECHYDANLDPDTETTDNFMSVVDRVMTPVLGYILQLLLHAVLGTSTIRHSVTITYNSKEKNNRPSRFN